MNLCWISNRGEKNSQLIPGATVGAAVLKRRVKAELLATELLLLPAGGGS